MTRAFNFAAMQNAGADVDNYETRFKLFNDSELADFIAFASNIHLNSN